MRARGGWPAVGVVLLGIGIGVWWWVTGSDDTGPVGEQVRLSQASQFTHVTAEDVPVHAGVSVSPHPRASGIRGPEEVEQALFEQGSLRGTALDGEWGVDAHGQLQPSRALRRRFDQLLTTQGEASREELGAWLRSKATREVGASAAQAILQIWHKYLVLEGQDYRYAVRLDHPDSLRWALQERQVKRREVLGLAWVEAFYAEEEALLTQTLASRHTLSEARNGSVSPALHAAQPHLSASEAHALRSALWGTAAADRLAELDRQEAQWQARLAQARAQWATTHSAAHLSAAQQRASFAQWLEAHFDDHERVRVQALLDW